MTQEEYEQEQREIERLVNEINRLIAENNALVQEINSAISDIRVLRSNVATLHRNVEPVMTGVSGEVNVQSEKIHRIFEALEELTAQYATFKTLSTASKNLSQYTDEYHTRFSYYNNLRRITLGYVIGLDTNFVTNESMRKAVEKVYLQNTGILAGLRHHSRHALGQRRKGGGGTGRGKGHVHEPVQGGAVFHADQSAL